MEPKPDSTIPVYRPDLTGREEEYVLDCVRSSWISSKGQYVVRFEAKFAEFTGAAHASAICNGTAALHVALLAAGIGPGDEVIVPTLTYIASVNAITYTGAKPVLVDSLPDTWQMDPTDVARKITPRTKALLPVHLYGHPCDMEALAGIARRHQLVIVEDCAEAIGTLYRGRHVGTFGQVGVFSFYGNKTITTGEGGMVVTNDAALLERAYRLKGQGLAPQREYWHNVVGYNYRMTNVCGAIGLAQLERADSLVARKRDLAARYRHALSGLPVAMHAESEQGVHSYWMVSILVEHARHRGPLRDFLAAKGVETRPLFYPAHTMPMYTSAQGHPVADDLSSRGINLPSWPALSDADVRYIADCVKRYYEAGA